MIARSRRSGGETRWSSLCSPKLASASWQYHALTLKSRRGKLKVEFQIAYHPFFEMAYSSDIDVNVVKVFDTMLEEVMESPPSFINYRKPDCARTDTLSDDPQSTWYEWPWTYRRRSVGAEDPRHLVSDGPK
ncbi:jg8239 [Pararge aegeria aegeria]|uniref:Jg8239 protein n=1 Tax=Pararge aegeria aegeria TaxID=348720 RepID=A0A8S4RPV6_9NEOP|nr:jg8239 [Pararge aegeria aegeria]